MGEMTQTAVHAQDTYAGTRPLLLAITVGAVGFVVFAQATAPMNVGLTATLVLLAPTLAATVVVDLRAHRIPNALTLTALVTAVLAIAVSAAVSRSVDLPVRAVVTSVVVGLLYLLLWRFAGLGLGDVKLAATLALVAGWAGWRAAVVFVLVAHLVQVPVAVWRLSRRRRERIAFAPALVAGLYLGIAVNHLAPGVTP